MRKLQAQGLHHVTLVGADRQTSIDFWEGVLGMPFVFEQPNLDRPSESHLYFDPGDGRLITIFTNEDRKPDPAPCAQDTGHVHHLAFSLSNAVFTDVLAGIQDALDQHGYQVLISDTRYSDAEEEKLLGINLQSHPDGVLLTGRRQSEQVRAMLEASQVPVVSMMDLSDNPADMTVGFSQQEAARTMVRHLLGKGRRRIGFLGAQLDERTLKRAEGYRIALREAGLYDARRELLVPDPSTVGLGAEMLGRLLAVAPDCDALFCCNDDLAYGAIYQCQRRGIAVPGQLAIAGFNDLPVSAWMNPSLTTIATPRYRIGFEAATLLRQVVEGAQPALRQIDLGFTLMARESA